MPPANQQWQQVLVIPVFNEAPTLLDTLAQLNTDAGKVLVILVLNRPENCLDSEINSPVRDALSRLPASEALGPSSHLAMLAPDVSVLTIDLETETGATPADKGVGLARKIGCDVALHWIMQDAINTQWICSSDADALLPRDYFNRLSADNSQSAALLFPFIHTASGEPLSDEACLRYELRLHHYVLGLQYAASPYAFHTLGSCIAVRATNYAKVRGFPARSAAEDFYLLNKLAKTGAVTQATGECIVLSSRPSDRVPFGTGPAIRNLAASSQVADAELYYHPEIFNSLRAVLLAAAMRYDHNTEFTELLQTQGLNAAHAQRAYEQLDAMGVEKALQHCRIQAGDAASFSKHFHQWFDGFRTLKFIHGLRDSGYKDLNLAELARRHPDFWPGGVKAEDLAQCRAAILNNWQWLTTD
ncbi:MAG: hypothetical protein ABJK20_18895 [Halieaceae bacterium]